MSRQMPWADEIDCEPFIVRKRPYAAFNQANPDSPSNAYDQLARDHPTGDEAQLHAPTPTRDEDPMDIDSPPNAAIADAMNVEVEVAIPAPGIFRRFTSFLSNLVPSILRRRAPQQTPNNPQDVDVAYVQINAKRQRMPGAWPETPSRTPSPIRRIATPPSRRPHPHYTSANSAAIEAQIHRDMARDPPPASPSPASVAIHDPILPGAFIDSPPPSPEIARRPLVTLLQQNPLDQIPHSSRPPPIDDRPIPFQIERNDVERATSNVSGLSNSLDIVDEIGPIRTWKDPTVNKSNSKRFGMLRRPDIANFSLHKPRKSGVQLVTDPLAMSLPKTIYHFSRRPGIGLSRAKLSTFPRSLSGSIPTKPVNFHNINEEKSKTSYGGGIDNNPASLPCSATTNNVVPHIPAQDLLAPEAINEDLSFLPDATPERADSTESSENLPHLKRHVHFARDGIRGANYKPTADKLKKYTKGEPIGHPVFPQDDPEYGNPRTPNTPRNGPLSTDTPTTTNSTPGLKAALAALESPSESRSPTTPDAVKQLEDDFFLFEISEAVREEREHEKAEREKREKLEAEARAKRQKEIEELERQEEEKYEQQAAKLKLMEEEKAKVKAKEKLEEAKRNIAKRLKIVKDLSFEASQELDLKLAMTDPSAEVIEDGLTRRDLGTLLPQNGADGIGWLNDEVVNKYIGFMISRMHEVERYDKKSNAIPSVYAFTTFLYTTYKKKGFSGISRWFDRAKLSGNRIFGVRRILIPINSGLHWTLLVISGTEKSVAYYDSLGGSGKPYIDFAKDILSGVLKSHWNEAEWDLADSAVSPQQKNGVDCGVFVCLNALAMVAGRQPELSYDHHDIPMARRMIGHVLINGGYTYVYDL